jgi:hypothetical protein
VQAIITSGTMMATIIFFTAILHQMANSTCLSQTLARNALEITRSGDIRALPATARHLRVALKTMARVSPM